MSDHANIDELASVISLYDYSCMTTGCDSSETAEASPADAGQGAVARLAVLLSNMDAIQDRAEAYLLDARDQLERRNSEYDRKIAAIKARIATRNTCGECGPSKRSLYEDSSTQKANPVKFIKRHKKGVPSASVAVLKKWVFRNLDNPYPSADEKELLASEAKIELKTLNYWFVNARRRIIPKLVAARRNLNSDAKEIHLEGSITHPSTKLPDHAFDSELADLTLNADEMQRAFELLFSGESQVAFAQSSAVEQHFPFGPASVGETGGTSTDIRPPTSSDCLGDGVSEPWNASVYGVAFPSMPFSIDTLFDNFDMELIELQEAKLATELNTLPANSLAALQSLRHEGYFGID